MLLTAAGCGRIHGDEIVVRSGERVVGRARLGVDQIVLLTDAPALVSIDLQRRRSRRRALARDPESPRLWGLGEVNGSLYSVEGFMDLVRLSPDGTRIHAATFQKPIGNLFDTEDAMGGQIAIDDPSMPLAWSIDEAGGMDALAGSVRQALGVSRAEEGVLHLLSCSVPPRVICWLPGSSQLFVLQDGRLDARLELESVGSLSSARMLERPESRVIQDALRTERDTIVAAVRPEPDKADTILAEYRADGRLVRRLSPTSPLRMLLGARAGTVFGVTTAGRLVGVPQ